MTTIVAPGNTTHNSTALGPDDTFDVAPTSLRAFYATVGVLSFICNGTLCIVVLRNKKMLKNAYNLLVLTLAVTDTVTGIFVTLSPSFVVGNDVMPIPGGVAGEIFCRLIQYNFFVWTFVKFSIAIVFLMAIERWFILARPMKYKLIFTRRNIFLFLAVLFGFCFIMTAPQLLDARLEMKGSKPICTYNSLGGNKEASLAYAFIYIITTVFLPFIVILVTYLHLRCWIINQHPPQTQAQVRRRQVEMALLRMTIAVALALAVWFIPNHFTYILVQYNLADWDDMKVVNALSMFNSVINPWLYCLTNKVYRKEFAKLICPCRANAIAQDTSGQDTSGQEKPTGSASVEMGVQPSKEDDQIC